MQKEIHISIHFLVVFLTVFKVQGVIPFGYVVTTTDNWIDAPQQDDYTTTGTPEIQIFDLSITCNVSNRYAHTLVLGRMKNNLNIPKEAEFSVVIPDTAYITGFILDIGGRQYDALIKDKSTALNEYKQAVIEGTSAALVAARDSNVIVVSVHLEQYRKAAFYLAYEELIQRHNNMYEVIININPGQPVKNLTASVSIDESSPLKFVKAPALRTGMSINQVPKASLNPSVDLRFLSKHSAEVRFSPTVEDQMQFATDLGTGNSRGLAAQFVVQYDVERSSNGGEVLLQDGYFVHFFAPENLPPVPKYTVFVLDTSGSMDGHKLEQMQEAMTSILEEINDEDLLSIVEFDGVQKVYELAKDAISHTYISTWTNLDAVNLPSPTPATEENIRNAQKVVSNFNADGGTDILKALQVALRIIQISKIDNRQAMIVFLTDGDPTSGETDTEVIISSITSLNKATVDVPIFSLAFGDGANKHFLRKLSLSNKGFSRYIYEESDAFLQLEDYYKGISSPLLSNVKFVYASDVDNVTKTNFPNFFAGKELVVSGNAPGNNLSAIPAVQGQGINGTTTFHPQILRPATDLKRLWAYLTIQQLLEEAETSDDKEALEKEALDLSLKYSFVTPVTSLIVVKPNGSDIVVNPVPTKQNGTFAPVNLDLRAPPTTTTSTTTTTTQKPTTTIPKKVRDFHPRWLQKRYNSTNDSITLKKGTFKMGTNTTVSEEPICPATPYGGTGHCKLIRECPRIHWLLSTVHIFKQYFCSITENGEVYVGVCCPTWFDRIPAN